ncbi:hypothetical protein OS190_02525 [Sulfitobacter sp. F26204]|uniref:hypothetical protein n=1 Tax=Sulfitobacter sp. F26204 TaxID=2996014 RepID=UPI00225DF874|nr:hypothetical protein [Sulfitobacter sp. F26204]MCX7558425.1 hypothetical protein [Sulfitobacter sp. F26204]
MTDRRPVVLILGSGPNVTVATDWPASWFDRIVVMNNAWRVRPDWDVLVYPEDFPGRKMPPAECWDRQLIGAAAFVPAQNLYGGFVHAGATMAFTTAYWALAALDPGVLAFMGCDMVYPVTGDTHFYGKGKADPLRKDISLRDLGAKSARLAMIAAAQHCACVNLSTGESSLVFERARPERLRGGIAPVQVNRGKVAALREREAALGYETPTGRYRNDVAAYDMGELEQIDAGWRALLIESS